MIAFFYLARFRYPQYEFYVSESAFEKSSK